MYPFSTLPTPALNNAARYTDGFGTLPIDALAIVIRAIAPDDRSTLLNLALVHKGAYFLLRQPRRETLALLAEDGAPKWRSAEIQDVRRYRHALHLAQAAHPTMSTEAAHALLSQWVEKIFAQSYHFMEYRKEVRKPMLKHMLATFPMLSMPQAGSLLWKLLVAQHKVWTSEEVGDDEAQGVLDLLRHAGSSLPDDARESFACACDLVGLVKWRWDFTRAGEALLASRLRWAYEGGVVDASLPFEALVMMMNIIASHLTRLPKPQRDAIALYMLEAAAAWPVRQRAAILAALVWQISVGNGFGRTIATAMQSHMLDLESMLVECAALPDEDKLKTLADLLRLVDHCNSRDVDCDDPDRKAALDGIVGRIGEGFIQQLLSVTPSARHRLALKTAMQLAMDTFYNWDRKNPQWAAGFTAVRKACAQRYGSADAVPPTCIGLALFRHSNRDSPAARRAALAPLLERGASADTSAGAATWRFYIDIIENSLEGRDFPRGGKREIALRHAKALLAAANDMPAHAWVDMMYPMLLFIDTTTDGYRFVHQVLQRAGKVPDEPRADLLERISYLLNDWEPAYQSSGVDLLLCEVDALNDRNKVRLLPRLVDLYLSCHPENSDAAIWLPAIMRMFASLPDARRMDALEAALDYHMMAKADPAVCAVLLPALEQQIATLPAQPQAGLLLCMALCLGQIRHARSEALLYQMLARFDKLDFSPQTKQAWKLLYRGAYLHASSSGHDHAAWPEVIAECDALPDGLRRDARAMLEYIKWLPRHSERKTAASSNGCLIA